MRAGQRPAETPQGVTGSQEREENIMYETSNGYEWERAVNIAHEKHYKIVKVERVK